jgi:hypothetical protein
MTMTKQTWFPKLSLITFLETARCSIPGTEPLVIPLYCIWGADNNAQRVWYFSCHSPVTQDQNLATTNFIWTYNRRGNSRKDKKLLEEGIYNLYSSPIISVINSRMGWAYSMHRNEKCVHNLSENMKGWDHLWDICIYRRIILRVWCGLDSSVSGQGPMAGSW